MASTGPQALEARFTSLLTRRGHILGKRVCVCSIQGLFNLGLSREAPEDLGYFQHQRAGNNQVADPTSGIRQ